MEDLHKVTEWKQVIQPALESKVKEFQLMGYDQATNEDIWNCLVKKVWNGNPEKRLYQVVGDIFQLRTNIYLSYLTVRAHQSDDLMASIAAVTEGKKS